MNQDARLKGKFKAKISNFHITVKFEKFTSYAKCKIVKVELIAKASVSLVNNQN